jgi:hypothetical protein
MQLNPDQTFNFNKSAAQTSDLKTISYCHKFEKSSIRYAHLNKTNSMPQLIQCP